MEIYLFVFTMKASQFPKFHENEVKYDEHNVK